MKRIEEIESLSLDDLEKISSDEKVKAPQSLRTRIAAKLFAAECRELAKRDKARFPFIYATAGLASILAIILLTALPKTPKDTFDDPVLARAELERTFAYISGKIDKGLDLVAETAPIIEKPAQTISRIKN